MTDTAPHRFPIRIYYEDTDLAGVVYYANYLRFAERGRSEWLRDLGIDQIALRDAQGVVFAVRRVEADYLRPARFGEVLSIETELAEMRGARMVFAQRLMRGPETLFAARITVACMTLAGAAARLPDSLRAALER